MPTAAVNKGETIAVVSVSNHDYADMISRRSRTIIAVVRRQDLDSLDEAADTCSTSGNTGVTLLSSEVTQLAEAVTSIEPPGCVPTIEERYRRERDRECHGTGDYVADLKYAIGEVMTLKDWPAEPRGIDERLGLLREIDLPYQNDTEWLGVEQGAGIPRPCSSGQKQHYLPGTGPISTAALKKSKASSKAGAGPVEQQVLRITKGEANLEEDRSEMGENETTPAAAGSGDGKKTSARVFWTVALMVMNVYTLFLITKTSNVTVLDMLVALFVCYIDHLVKEEFLAHWSTQCPGLTVFGAVINFLTELYGNPWVELLSRGERWTRVGSPRNSNRVGIPINSNREEKGKESVTESGGEPGEPIKYVRPLGPPITHTFSTHRVSSSPRWR